VRDRIGQAFPEEFLEDDIFLNGIRIKNWKNAVPQPYVVYRIEGSGPDIGIVVFCYDLDEIINHPVLPEILERIAYFGFNPVIGIFETVNEIRQWPVAFYFTDWKSGIGPESGISIFEENPGQSLETAAVPEFNQGVHDKVLDVFLVLAVKLVWKDARRGCEFSLYDGADRGMPYIPVGIVDATQENGEGIVLTVISKDVDGLDTDFGVFIGNRYPADMGYWFRQLVLLEAHERVISYWLIVVLELVNKEIVQPAVIEVIDGFQWIYFNTGLSLAARLRTYA
jgi:hypothetical protein